jgi:HK97 family phage major capsid protein
VGTSTDCSEAYVGDFRELLIGIRTAFKLEASRVAGSAFENLQVYIRAYIRADIALAHPKLFTVVQGIRG